jgi:CHAD domain-containing protein
VRAAGPGWAAGSLRLAEVVRVQQRHLKDVIARLGESSVEDVHQGRVAARRLRSILKTFGPLFDARWARLYRMDLRSFARALAMVREADVHGEVLRDAVGSREALRSAELARLAAALQLARSDARDHLRKRATEHGWRALTASLAERAEQPVRIARPDAGMPELVGLADRAWRKANRLMKRRPQEAQALHELRLALKHCRYALEIVADVEPRSAARLLRRLRRAQEAIGAHRDTITAAHWIRSRERTLGRATVRRLEAFLVEREAGLRRDAAAQSAKVPPAYEAWREAIRPLRKEARSGRA